MRIHVMAGVLLLASGLTACDDPTSGFFEPIIRDDTVDLAAPLVDPGTPTALDVAYASSLVLGRFPELVADAEQWDFAIRREGGELRLVPAGIFGFQNPVGGPSTAVVSLPLGQALNEVRRAPGAQLDSVRAVTLQEGAVYVMRSRRTNAAFGGCENYAKVRPLEVDAAAGRVKLHVVGNARCNDPRLVEED